jgi:hypothetical protein
VGRRADGCFLHSGFWAVPAYEPSDRLRYGSTPVFGQFLPTSRPTAYATAALRFLGSSCLRAVRPPTLRQHSGFRAVPAYEPSDRLRYGSTPVFGQFLPTSRPTAYATAAPELRAARRPPAGLRSRPYNPINHTLLDLREIPKLRMHEGANPLHADLFHHALRR